MTLRKGGYILSYLPLTNKSTLLGDAKIRNLSVICNRGNSLLADRFLRLFVIR